MNKIKEFLNIDDNTVTALGIVFFIAIFIALLIFTFITLNPYKEPVNADRVEPRYQIECIDTETGEIVDQDNCYLTMVKK